MRTPYNLSEHHSIRSACPPPSLPLQSVPVGAARASPMSTPLIVDDRNPSVVYSATGWTIQGLVPAFNQTLHVTSEKDTSVSLTFEGTGIEIYTSRKPTSTGGRPTMSYSIDGGQVVEVDYESFVSDGPMLFNIKAFTLTDMPLGLHVLNISNLNGTSPNMFLLDYFIIYSSLPPTTEASSTSTDSAVPTGLPESSSSSSLPPSTQTMTTNEGRTRSSTSRVGIFGGAVGGSLSLILVVIAVFLWWRVRRRKATSSFDPHRSRRTPILSTTSGSPSFAEPRPLLLPIHSPPLGRSGSQVQRFMSVSKRPNHPSESSRPPSTTATAATSTSPSDIL
ncbi:hypothetical protein L226DRAFT_139247 [Lentinus tigrinus ALCF2SS1-7]|uniref:uncharacterized protein n=1 Tax=Lentinus tigrinus ALCF2SS1-7 TaxID=1328758 RepID=UPI001165E320|nr:hypothetical protein L226DRAFT_139247 [Lentinus tigrinus ALCF2SS1-7]